MKQDQKLESRTYWLSYQGKKLGGKMSKEEAEAKCKRLAASFQKIHIVRD